MELARGLTKNLMASIVDKGIAILGQFASLFLMVRFLSRESYGEWGVALSLFVFIHFINIGCEAILYREHRDYQHNVKEVLASFFHFASAKLILFYITAAVLSLFYPSSTELHWGLMAMATLMGGEAWIAGLQTFFIVKLRQDLVAKASLIKAFLSLFILSGVILLPSLKYIFFKELMVALVSVLIYLHFLQKYFFIAPWAILFGKGSRKFIVDGIKRYSLWVHLIGVTTNFIYKSDIFFLSLFSPLALVGNYTISLNSANFANILPALLGQQASVALGHLDSNDKSLAVTHLFIRWSIVLSLLTLIAFYLFGAVYLQMMTGEQNVDSMFFYLLCIVGGLVIVKSFASPLVAYLNILSDVRRLFWRVNLPLLVISATTYYLAARLWQDRGVAYANIVNSVIWVLFVLIEAHRSSFRWNGFFDISFEKKLIARWSKK